MLSPGELTSGQRWRERQKSGENERWQKSEPVQRTKLSKFMPPVCSLVTLLVGSLYQGFSGTPGRSRRRTNPPRTCNRAVGDPLLQCGEPQTPYSTYCIYIVRIPSLRPPPTHPAGPLPDKGRKQHPTSEAHISRGVPYTTAVCGSPPV